MTLWIKNRVWTRWRSGPIDATPLPVETSRTPSLYSRFVRIADGLGTKIAIEYGHERISYKALHIMASAIAAQLPVDRSDAPRTALLFHHRIRAIGAMFGALGAGHAFVPLDIADPEERIRFILNDCEPSTLLTDTENLERARQLAPTGCNVIDIQAPLSQQRDITPNVDPDRLAFLCYTSGSTGQPKGVCQTHRNLFYFVLSYCRTLGIDGDDRLSLLYSLSFAASNMDIFGGLLNGATVYAYDMREQGIPGLVPWLNEHRISILHAVPTVFRKLTANLHPGETLNHVRAIDLGGEAVTTTDVRLFKRHFRRDCKLVNHLAATEASVIAQHVVDNERNYTGDALPVGQRAEGISVRIENDDGSEAGSGEIGRIVIRSPYISPGYWRRPELNTLTFSNDAARPGWRVFRTEDLGRIDANGELYFLGRAGTRVKIRGQSVDLAEVEAALRQCAGVHDAAVVATYNDGPEADRLVAHVVLATTSTPDPKQLRRELGGCLPHYMLPTAFAFPKSLPTTASGKIDRRTLAALRVADTESDTSAQAQNDVEEAVADIFSRLLNRATIGRTDDFFLLGGDSMSAVELQLSLSRLIKREVPVKDIFQDPTVAGLAATLQRHAAMAPTTEPLSVLVPVRENGKWPALFLVHGKLGQAHISTHFLQLLGEDQPMYAFRARGLDGLTAPNHSIEDAVNDYITAMRTVQPHGPYILGGLCSGSYITMAMAQKLAAEGETVLPLLLIDPPGVRRKSFLKRWQAKLSRHHRRYRVERNEARLRMLQNAGRISIDLDDPERRRTALAAVMALHDAFTIFRPTPYKGCVHLLLNRAGLKPTGWGNPSKIRACFAGELQIREVADTSNEVLDVKNPELGKHIGEYLQRIRTHLSSTTEMA